MADDEKIARFRKLIEQNPNDEMANFSLGSALLQAANPKEAAACFQRVLALSSRNSKAYQLLGEAQRQSGDVRLAIETITNGCRVAQRQGDMMPLRAMADMLKELGAEVPLAGEQKAGTAGPGGARAGESDFACRRCGGSGPQLSQRPFKGPLGQQILASICQSCWSDWVRMGTRVINELGLSMSDPIAQETYDRHMKEFLMLD
jgi:Fe-S cluster biosynthesis and repair protein YggX